jgi:hypothetical protein
MQNSFESVLKTVHPVFCDADCCLVRSFLVIGRQPLAFAKLGLYFCEYYRFYYYVYVI